MPILLYWNERMLGYHLKKKSKLLLTIEIEKWKINIKEATSFLGANAPLEPDSSEGLYVCLYVCMSVYMSVTL